MIQFKTDQGEISVSSAVFTNITGMAATNRFGVKGMAYRSMTDGLVHLLRREAMSKGVSITYNDDETISIELHIVVENGVNLPAVCSSAMSAKPSGMPSFASDFKIVFVEVTQRCTSIFTLSVFRYRSTSDFVSSAVLFSATILCAP